MVHRELRSDWCHAVVAVLGRQLFCVLIVVVACGCQWATAETAVPEGQPLVHQIWTFKDGAPEGARAFAQTADGYLWVGAPDVLFRFDGVRLALVEAHPRVPSRTAYEMRKVPGLQESSPGTRRHEVGDRL